MDRSVEPHTPPRSGDGDARWRALLGLGVDALAVGVVLQDGDGTVRASNAAAHRIFGLEHGELEGRGPSDPAWRAIGVDGSPLAPSEHPTMRALATGEPQHGVRIGVSHPDGERRWLRIDSVPLRQEGDAAPYGAISSLVDITDRRAMEESLRESEERFRTVFAEAPIAMGITDVDLAIQAANPAFCDLLGRTCEELEAMSIDDVTHPDDIALGRKQAAALVAGEIPRYRIEKRYVHSSGAIVWCELSVSIVRDGEGRPLYLLGQIQDITERKHLEHELEHLALHDHLSGLLNRRAFERELMRHVERGRRYGNGGALLLLDLDDFKEVNDTYGHRAGDDLIAAVARRLERRLRTTDVVGRIGGDEFAVLLPMADARTAEHVAAALRDAVRGEPIELDGRPHTVTVSIGIAPLDEAAGRVDALAAADAAMYAAKAAGRDRSAVFEADRAGELRAR